MFLVTVRIFYMNLLEGKNAATAESMFNSVDNLFDDHDIQ